MVTSPPILDPKASLWNEIAVNLRHCREQRGLSGEALGRIIAASKSTVSRIETGKDRLSSQQAYLLDIAWDTGGHWERQVFFASIGHSPQWLTALRGFEQESRLVRIFEPKMITSLMQTEDYARAMLLTGGSPDFEKHFAERMERRAVLDHAFVTVVYDEVALRCPIGTPKIMREQLAHLLELSEGLDLVVHVIPSTFETANHVGLDGALKLLTGDEFGEVAYTGALGGGRLVSSPREVAEYGVRYARIMACALNQEQSRTMIRKIMEEFQDDEVAEE